MACCLTALEDALDRKALLRRSTNNLQQLHCLCADGPCSATAPNGLTLWHAAALADRPDLINSAAEASPGQLDAELDRESKYHLHAWAERRGLALTTDKHVSKLWRRLHGLSPLETAVALGRPEAAAALLGAGAAVRPQAWAALAASHCPAPCKDTLAALLVARHPCPAALAPHWPASYRRAVQALLLSAHRGRCLAAAAAAAEGGCADGATAQQPALLLARLPRELLLQVAALAAAPRSAW